MNGGSINDRSALVVDAAMRVHSALGPGLLESSYQTCLARELTLRGLRWEQQMEVALWYKGTHARSAYRIDFLVEGRLVVDGTPYAAGDVVHLR